MIAGFKPKGVFGGDDIDPISEELKTVKKAKKKSISQLKKEMQNRFDDDFDAIYEAYTNPKKRDKLTPTQKRQLARWKFARQWMSEFEPFNDAETVQALRTEYGISYRQAYVDIINTKRFFASINKVNQEFDKVIFIERLLRTRQKSMMLGTAKGFDVASRCDAILAKIQGYDREQHDMPIPVIVQVEESHDLAVIGVKPVENLQAVIKGFWKKKEEEREREIEDVDYDELLNNPRNEHEHRK